MSTPTVREQFLVISALGANPMELTNVLCRASHENRCAVVTSRLTRHGEYSALVLEISGSWDALARLEGSLPVLAKRHAFTVNVVRSAALENRPQALPYVAYVSSAYRSDIINELCQFFMDHNVELENLTCDTYQAPQTGGTMLNATFTVTLPAGVQISWLRDQFIYLMAVYGIIQTLDGNVLVPLLFSEAVNLHPVVIICAVLLFGGLWGFWGVFFAIPLATLFKAVLDAWPRKEPEVAPLL